MIIDSRRYPTVSSPLLINNQAAERERQYKYLSTGIVDKLTVEPSSGGLQTKGCAFIGDFLLLTWATLYGGGFSLLFFHLPVWISLFLKNGRQRLNGAVKVTERITLKDLNKLDLSELERKKPRLFKFQASWAPFQLVQLWIHPLTLQVLQIVHRCDSSSSYVSLCDCPVIYTGQQKLCSPPLWPWMQINAWMERIFSIMVEYYYCIIALCLCLGVNLMLPQQQ